MSGRTMAGGRLGRDENGFWKGETSGGMGSRPGVCGVFIFFFGPCLTVLTVSCTCSIDGCDITFLLLPISHSSHLPMSSTICPGCNCQFTHSGYSHHLSLTRHAHCRSHYLHQLGLSATTESGLPGVSGQADPNPSGGSVPEIGDLSAYVC